MQNRFENAVNVSENVVVPKPNDVIAPFLQNARAFGILGCALAMLAAVDLDDEFQIERDEVDDIIANRLLSFELDSFKPAATQSRPQQFLGVGRAPAERTGELSHRPPPLTLPSPRRGEGFAPSFAQRLGSYHNRVGFC